MIKDIRFSTLASIPSDFDAPDGQLQLASNIITEDAALKPASAPAKLFRIVGADLLLKHGDRYIFAQRLGQATFLFYKDAQLAIDAGTVNVSLDGSASNAIALNPAQPIYGFRSAVAHGNLLIIATDSALQYAIFRNDGYDWLGPHPQLTPIEFGIQRRGALPASCQIKTPTAMLPVSGASAPHAASSSLQAESHAFSDAVYGQLLSHVSSSVSSKGFFYQPFFVRYAARLFDGSYIWHSAPILMLPTVFIPCASYSIASADGDETTLNLDLSQISYFELRYRILNSLPAAWEAVISSIDIFVSAPIYTYDQSAQVYPGMSRFGNLVRDLSTGRRGRQYNASDDPSTFFAGHFSVFGDSYGDCSLGSVASLDALSFKANDRFADDIKDAAIFYKIASLPFDQITPSDSFSPVPIDSSDLSNINTRETLPDDYQSHCQLVASSLFSYNARLNVAISALAAPPPFPLRTAAAATSAADYDDIQIFVFTKTSGLRTYTVADDPLRFAPLRSQFPRYIFYPDPSAYRMVIRQGQDFFSLDLTAHAFLNGAYWFGGTSRLDLQPLDSPFTIPYDAGFDTLSPISNKIYTSEVNNPFFFPLAGINTVGDGTISALSAATKALSEGQYGQFPLYAFSSDGIWALEVQSDGFYRTSQPVSRDVCLSPRSITQTDSAVVFPSMRGLMLLSGAQTVCLSDDISSVHSPLPSNIALQLYRLSPDSSPLAGGGLIPFTDFIAACRIAYDYTNQRLIITSPAAEYAYVYSLRYRSWGMLQPASFTPVPSYPQALAVDSQSCLVDLAAADLASPASSGIILTRPLKLGDNTLKTITSLIIRGAFRKGHVKTILYGSRNLFDWHLIHSSQDHYLRGFRGTPYKYFRIALLTALAPDESISGATVDFTPRLTNQIR